MYNQFTKKIPSNFSFSGKKNTFLNPYSYLLLRSEHDLIKQIDNFYIDGISLVIFLKIFGIKTKRLSFDMTSIAPILFNHCIEENKSIYFIGSKKTEIEKSLKNFKIEYPKLNIIGSRDGYFKENEISKISHEIISLNPDFLIVGMGTPTQEHFITHIFNSGFKGTSYTCGGFLHQSAKKTIYYPSYIDKLNIRWIYRIYDEPKLLRRYIIDYPKAFILLFYDLIRHKIS